MKDLKHLKKGKKAIEIEVTKMKPKSLLLKVKLPVKKVTKFLLKVALGKQFWTGI